MQRINGIPPTNSFLNLNWKSELVIWIPSNQFRFKKRVGWRDAIYALHSVVHLYTEDGSTVTLCILDMSEAFDKVNRYGLYLKLMKRNMPPIFHELTGIINVEAKSNWIMCCPDVCPWSVMFGMVGFSRWCCSLYTRWSYCKVIINNFNLDSFIGGLYLGCITYAGDLVRIQLQCPFCRWFLFVRMIYIDMKFNTSESIVTRIDKIYKTVCENIVFAGTKIDHVSKHFVFRIILRVGLYVNHVHVF